VGSEQSRGSTKPGNRIPSYCTGNDIEQHVEFGYKKVKLAIPYGPADGREGMKKNTELVKRTRQLLGPDGEIMLFVDGKSSFETLQLRLHPATTRVARLAEERPVTFIAFDLLLCAVGRVANTAGYGLEEMGIGTTAQRTVETNDYLQTIYPNIFACGDVAGPYQFTHTASHQAWYASVNALFGQFRKFRADYAVIPWATFTDPEVARVGLNESEANARGIACEVTTYNIDDLDRAITDAEAYGLVKVLTVPGKDRILGATIVGAHAGELIVEFITAMKQGVGLNKILSTIHIYPTLSEANKYAAGNWKRAHAPQSVLRWVERYHAWMRG
jgi:pyruvate/2-oxoglutarate dehydrogenase complex dihydrolipoamide dehydrogenase (E3) component